MYEHKDAVMAAIFTPMAAVEALALYEAPLASLFACFFWQVALVPTALRPCVQLLRTPPALRNPTTPAVSSALIAARFAAF